MLIENLYDKLFKEADEICKQYISPWCDIIDGKCSYSRSEEKRVKNTEIKPNCCGSCQLNQNGCTTKNLKCKIYHCGYISNKIPMNIEKRLEKIQDKFYEYNFAGYYHTRECAILHAFWYPRQKDHKDMDILHKYTHTHRKLTIKNITIKIDKNGFYKLDDGTVDIVSYLEKHNITCADLRKTIKEIKGLNLL